MNDKRVLLRISLLLNLLFVLASVIFAVRRSGILIRRAPEEPPKPLMQFPSYRSQRSIYDSAPTQHVSILFAGDSLTNNGVWGEWFHRPILNRGIQGDTTEGLKDRLPEIVRHQPGQIFLLIGINDLRRGRTPHQALDEVRSVLNHLSNQLPACKIYLQSLLPVHREMIIDANPSKLQANILTLNRGLEELGGKQVTYIDVYSSIADENGNLKKAYTWDGLHLNARGYAQWRKALIPYMK